MTGAPRGPGPRRAARRTWRALAYTAVVVAVVVALGVVAVKLGGMR